MMSSPAKWVASAIDAHKRLGFDAMGIRVTAFDPADTGDPRAVVNRHGSVVKEAKQLKQGDIRHAIPWAYEAAEAFRADVLTYDGDGMGAPTMKLALTQRAPQGMRVAAYHGSAGVMDPEKPYDRSGAKHKLKPKEKRTEKLHDGESLRVNKDMFRNFRAQSWTWVRDRFELTHEAVTRAQEGKIVTIDPELLISIDSGCKEAVQLQAELSRPRRLPTPNGLIRVESKDEMKSRNVSSPNLADALVMAYATSAKPKKAGKKTELFEHPIHDAAVGY